jgi:putative two-component system response regulator
MKDTLRKARILIVDDLPVNLKVLSDILRLEGYDPHPVSNGQTAIEVAGNNPPDLVLLDIRMPDMDGYEVCRLFKADPRLASIPIIFLSAGHQTEEKVKAFSIGGIDYITKPFVVEELRSRIATHLRMHTLQNELEDNNLRLEERVAAQVKELLEAQLSTIYALARLAERRDDDTGKHVERVQALSRSLALILQKDSPYRDEIDERFVRTIYQAAALHDVGKVAIPDAVLLKPGKLSSEEFVIMKTHAQIGAETLEVVSRQHSNNFFLEMGIEVARSHHEKWDGWGYPQGLAGTAIPLSARIVAVADFFDAVSSDRVYRPAFTRDEVRVLVQKGAGQHFDGSIVGAFLLHEEELHAAQASMVSGSMKGSMAPGTPLPDSR